MILDIYLGRVHHIGPVRCSARNHLRLARRLERSASGARVVISNEDDLTPSQTAMLNAIADQQELELRELCAELA